MARTQAQMHRDEVAEVAIYEMLSPVCHDRWGAIIANALTALCTDKGISPEAVERAANEIGLAGHMAARR